MSLVAGHESETDGRDGVGEAARFFYIYEMLCTRDRKRLYASDYSDHKIRAIELDSRVVSTAAGTGLWKWMDGNCLEAGFIQPTRMVFDRSSNVEPESAMWIVATGLRRFDIKHGVVTTVQLPLKPDAVTSIDSTPAGALIVVIQNCVCLIDPRTQKVDKLAGSESEADFVDGAGVNARFNSPATVVVAEWEQCAYILDANNNRIRRITLPPTLFT